MFIELLDTLRCVQAHEDSWLVGSFDELVDRHIIRGTLGCPVCGAEYPVRGGVADFRISGDGDAGEADVAAAPGPQDESAAMRLATLLGVAEPGGIFVLMGASATAAPALEALVPGVQFLLVNPTSPVFPFASAVRTEATLPIASGSVRGAVFDPAGAADMTPLQAARVIAAGGRLVAPAAEPVPAGITELARDGTQWVGERQDDATGPVLRLTRRR